MKEKIAHIRLRYLRNTETFIYEEVTGVKKYDPLVFCIDTANLDVFPFSGVRSLSSLSPASYAFNAASWMWLKRCPYFERLIRDEGVALLHAQYGREGLFSIKMKENCGVPLITNFQGWDASTIPKKEPHIYDRLFKAGDRFIAKSADMKKDLIGFGCPEEKIVIHHQGIDLEKFKFSERLPVSAGENVNILMICRFVETKGIPYAVEAFAKASKSHPNMEMTVIGDGILRLQIEDMVKQLGLEGKIKLTGYVPHERLIYELKRAHIFIQPSITDSKGEKEGTTTTIPEAQAMGIPAIGTYHAGIPEALVDGKSGFLVKEKDVDALAEKLNFLIEHQELWKELGVNGRKHVEKEFNTVVQSRKLEDIYTKLLNR